VRVLEAAVHVPVATPDLEPLVDVDGRLPGQHRILWHRTAPSSENKVFTEHVVAQPGTSAEPSATRAAVGDRGVGRVTVSRYDR
jgi:hypothetical protein